MLFLVNCGGDDNDSSDSSSGNSSQENSVTISGTTIPLTLDTEDKIFSQKVLEWNDGNTFSYLEQNKKVMTYLSASGNYSSHSERDGYWDVRKDNNELWVLFKDGELYRFEVTTDGNNYIQYITRINSDAKLTHLVDEPEQPLLEQIAQDSAAIQVVDGNGNIGEQPGAIKVYGVLTFGEHGTFKECNGLQMAFNSALDLDEIRIEQGTYECNGLEIPSNKTFEHGIKVSGGWDSGFNQQSNDPALTVLDGGNKIIADVENQADCETVAGVWGFFHKCFQKEWQSRQFLTVNAGPVDIEMLSFQNYSFNDGGIGDYYGGAIYGGDVTNINYCIFANNSAESGGAVFGANNINNSTFTNNSAGGGGAVGKVTTINNSTFTNNYAGPGGGAVSHVTTINNSTFTNNSAGDGGAVIYAKAINNSTFTSNMAQYEGGAVFGTNTITNSIFTNNSAIYGGAVYNNAYLGSKIVNSLFNKNTATKMGGAIYNGTSASYISTPFAIINCTIVNNTASESGGGFYGYDGHDREDFILLNNIFAQNTAAGELNDIVPNGGDMTVDYTLVNYISGAVDYGTHNIMGDPNFVDAENDDYRLSADSPAINLGDSSVLESCVIKEWDKVCYDRCYTSSSAECKAECYICGNYPFLRDDEERAIDFDGNPRVVGGTIDLGAYEVQ